MNPNKHFRAKSVYFKCATVDFKSVSFIFSIDLKCSFLLLLDNCMSHLLS